MAADDPLRGPLVAQTTVLLHAAGRSDEAKAFADEYLQEVLPTAEEAEVCLSIASMFALSPDVRADASRRALMLPGLSTRDRVRHLARLAYNLIQAGRPEEARSMLADARDVITSEGDATAASILMLADGALLYVEGRFDRPLRVHEAAMRHRRAAPGADRCCLRRPATSRRCGCRRRTACSAQSRYRLGERSGRACPRPA